MTAWMSANALPILVALLGFLGVVIAALITAMIGLQSKNRELRVTSQQNEATQRIAEWEQWRKDNEALRADITQLRDEIRTLETKIDDLGTSKRQAEADRDAKQQECDKFRRERDKAVRDRDAAMKEASSWKAQYEKEHAVANIFTQLYDYLSNGRTPDPVTLETMREQLAAAAPASSVPVPPSPKSLTP